MHLAFQYELVRSSVGIRFAYLSFRPATNIAEAPMRE